MARNSLDGALLATGSLLALIVGMEGSAQAAACSRDNVSPPIDNVAASDCITFHGGGAFGGNVVNDVGGTLTPTGVYTGGHGTNLPGTASGISVLGSGTTLTGNIINNGTIDTTLQTLGQGAINIGGGEFNPGPTSGAGASVVGSITNNSTITGPATGVNVDGNGTSVTGSITNATNGTITSTGGVGIAVTNNARVGGSIINDGMINVSTYHGIEINTGAIITGNVINSAMGTIKTLGSAGMNIAGGSSIGGSVTNAGTISATHYGILVAPSTVTGSVVNSGNMTTGGYGFAVFGSSSVLSANINGNVSNGGTINANGRDGIGIFAFSNIGGAVQNTNQITAARNGILVVNTSSTAGVAVVSGGISNSGSIISNGTGFAGIALVGGTVSLGITNTATGTLQSNNGVGILISNQDPAHTSSFASTLTGGITNQGTITAKTGIVIGGLARFPAASTTTATSPAPEAPRSICSRSAAARALRPRSTRTPAPSPATSCCRRWVILSMSPAAPSPAISSVNPRPAR